MASPDQHARPRSPSPGEAAERPRKHTLPPDVMRQAGRRLSLAALIYAGAYLLAYGSERMFGGDFDWYALATERVPLSPDAWAGLFIGLSVGLFFFARSGLVSPARLLTVGLVFEVVGAYGIDFSLLWGVWPEATAMAGVSWVCVWIVFFPMIVPAPPLKAAVATVLAGSATPVLYFLGVARGGVPLPTDHIAQMFAANAICIGIALVGSRVVYRLGSDIGRARRMGAYRLVRKLGEGGMGEVWMAEHHLLARAAAIKLVRRDRDGSGTPSESRSHHHRFEREVQATSLLRSPHTVEVYDFGRTDDGRFYYVMELLDGLSLEELVGQHGPVPAERAVAILDQVCHSLAEAHARGLVHRDIKPANIFVCRYGLEHDFVKVLDFGLVKATGGTSDVRLTDAGAFAGTPAYGSPEGAMGGDVEVDGRSDLYSLGCVMHWLLTGRPVFEGRQPMQVILQHVNQPPEPPSRHTELPIPPDLDALVVQLLSKAPEDRPASAEEVRAMLERIPLTTPWTQERAREWWNRHRPSRTRMGITSLDDVTSGEVVQPVMESPT